MLTWLEIDKSAINHNLRQFKKIIGPKIKLMAIVKSNAYGHGMVEVAKIALKSGADWLGVINLGEAFKLRQAKIKAPIFILSYWDIGDMGGKYAQIRDIDFSVYTLEQAKILSQIAQKIKRPVNVHIKIDTGASRIGVMPNEIVNFVKELKKMPRLNVRGLFTHYAASEREDQSYTDRQTKIFSDILANLRLLKINIPLIHAGCSASTIINPATYFNLVRIGIAMYGLWPSDEIKKVMEKKRTSFYLEPALSWKTKVIQVKKLPAATFIGYDCTYQAKRETRIAILPVGYWEGYDRKLSNCGEVLINGRRCPVRGRICMNLTVVEVGHIPNVKAGDEVVLIGEQACPPNSPNWRRRRSNKEITADELAEKVGTINYEVVTRINPLVPRIYL